MLDSKVPFVSEHMNGDISHNTKAAHIALIKISLL